MFAFYWGKFFLEVNEAQVFGDQNREKRESERYRVAEGGGMSPALGSLGRSGLLLGPFSFLSPTLPRGGKNLPLPRPRPAPRSRPSGREPGRLLP